MKKTKRAKNLLFMLRGIVGSYWGPSPKMILWAYTAMVKPILTYCNYIWGANLTQKQNKKLQEVQDLALSLIGQFRNGTPKEALGIIFGIEPLDLHLLGVRMNTAKRISGKIPAEEICQAKTIKKGHIQTTLDILKQHGIDFTNSDRIDRTTILDRYFEIDYYSMSKKDAPINEAGYNCYTDGSKTRRGVGLGACLYKDGTLITEAGEPMDTHNTVFQAETTAFLLAC